MIKITCTLFLQIQCISPIQALNFLELYHDIQIPSQTRLITHASQFLPSHFQQQASQFYYYYRYIQRGNRVHAHRVL